MTTYCPDCLVIEVPPNAREGRCAWCRTQVGTRRRNPVYRNAGLTELYETHRRGAA